MLPAHWKGGLQECQISGNAHLCAGFPPDHWKSTDGWELSWSENGAGRQQSQSRFLQRSLLDFVQGGQEGQDAAGWGGTEIFAEACSDSASDAGDQPGRNTLGQGVQTAPLFSLHFCSTPLVRLVHWLRSPTALPSSLRGTLWGAVWGSFGQKDVPG